MSSAASPTTPPPSDSASTATLGELTTLFLRLGFTAFGGPAAHLALMRSEVVSRRKWMSEEEYLDLIGAANLVPGPNSTEVAIHIGLKMGGWAGLLLAGLCFILPAALIVGVFAWAYVGYGQLPPVAGVLYAVKPVIIAVVLQALFGLARPALRTWLLRLLGAGALVLALTSAPVLSILFGAGAVTGVTHWWTHERKRGEMRPLIYLLLAVNLLIALPSALTAFIPLAPDGSPVGIAPLFLFFLKVGATLYGSGYVLLAFLRDQLVHRWYWLTEAQLLDATAIGQVTPGPVFTTATFIGYIIGGVPGAVVATLGIFLPSFLFVAGSGPLIPRLRRSPLASAFLDGVNAAALGLMASVLWSLGRAALIDIPTILIALFSAVLLLYYRLNSAYLILGASLLGLLSAFFLHHR